LRFRGVLWSHLSSSRGPSQTKPYRGIYSRIGKVCERPRRVHDRPNAADISERNKKRGFTFHAAQQPHCLRFVVTRGDCADALVQKSAQMIVRIGLE
jgi:hypothetical protein